MTYDWSGGAYTAHASFADRDRRYSRRPGCQHSVADDIGKKGEQPSSCSPFFNSAERETHTALSEQAISARIFWIVGTFPWCLPFSA